MDKKKENTGKLKAQPRDSHIYTLETQKEKIEKMERIKLSKD